MALSKGFTDIFTKIHFESSSDAHDNERSYDEYHKTFVQKYYTSRIDCLKCGLLSEKACYSHNYFSNMGMRSDVPKKLTYICYRCHIIMVMDITTTTKDNHVQPYEFASAQPTFSNYKDYKILEYEGLLNLTKTPYERKKESTTFTFSRNVYAIPIIQSKYYALYRREQPQNPL